MYQNFTCCRYFAYIFRYIHAYIKIFILHLGQFWKYYLYKLFTFFLQNIPISNVRDGRSFNLTNITLLLVKSVESLKLRQLCSSNYDNRARACDAQGCGYYEAPRLVHGLGI